MCYTALFFYHIFPEKVKGKMKGKGKSPSKCSDGDLFYGKGKGVSGNYTSNSRSP